MSTEKATDQVELRSLCLELRQLSEANGLTQQMLASALRISQAQVSRILSGQIGKQTRHFKRLSVYVSRYRCPVSMNLVRESDLLLAAVADVWDGTPEHEINLAAVIRSLGKLKWRQLAND